MAKPEGYVIPPLNAETEFIPLHDMDLSDYKQIFPKREGARPETTTWEPHQQIDQHAPAEIWDELNGRALALPGVTAGKSLVSMPETVAWHLDEELAKGPEAAFIIEREFAHIHPRPDSSTHLHLPPELVIMAISAGWGEIHTMTWLGLAPTNTIMLFAPRDEEELEFIWSLVEESYRFATGQPPKYKHEPQTISGAAA
jgi:phospholipase/carboxylesterase